MRGQLIVGFTGTLAGMSPHQKTMFRRTMSWLHDVAEFHHGDAVGADTEAKRIAEDYLDGIEDIIPHPANGRPLERNKEIVMAVDILIAAPRTDKEQLRSGTWTTIRRARDKGIPIVILPRGPKK